MKAMLLALALLMVFRVHGRGGDGSGSHHNSQQGSTTGLRGPCTSGTQSRDLKINNVRAKLRNGGDIWWDGQNGKYIVPQVAPGEVDVSSLFAGAIWLGAYDDREQLFVAAQTYRTDGNDFWPGPLTESNLGGETESATCTSWDVMFECYRSEVTRHRRAFDLNNIPDNVKYWPGRGNRFMTERYPNLNSDQMDRNLAPFFDMNNNCIYEPDLGEYPIVEVRGCPSNGESAVPDQMIWWVYNDNGNIHTETDGGAMKMEIQCTAFSYVTSDDVNNMTFYRYKLINRRSNILKKTWFSVWTDPDLGCEADDYIACDTTVENVNRRYELPNGRVVNEPITRHRDLGIVYNGDANDERTNCPSPGNRPTPGYGTTIPALGLDYFRGPLETLRKDRNGDGVIQDYVDYDSFQVNCFGVRDTFWRRHELGMTNFMYYKRGTDDRGDPQGATQYMNLMQSKWRQGTTHLTVGGTGFNPGGGVQSNFAFPGDPSDNSSWTMCSANVPVDDMRFLHVSGPFELLPGDINELITGVVWVAKHIEGSACQSFKDNLLQADLLAQSLFDNCFKLVEGPNAPNLDIVEVDKELILSLSYNGYCDNGCGFDYSEREIRAAETVYSDRFRDSLQRFVNPATGRDTFITISYPDGQDTIVQDVTYDFEGYKIYQLAKPIVTDLNDPQLARLVFQCDVKNKIGEIVNHERDQISGRILPVLKTEQFANNGIRHTFKFTSDQFALTNDKTLKNHKKYYFKVVAYAHNEFRPYDLATKTGQDKPYIQGRIASTGVGIPRINSPEYYGLVANSVFGSGPSITRYDGKGNVGNFLDVSNDGEVELDLFSTNAKAAKIIYRPGQGPIDVYVNSPLRVTNDSCVLTIFDDNPVDDQLDGIVKWSLKQLDDLGNAYAQWTSMTTLNHDFDQNIPDLGITIRASIQPLPGCDENDLDGFVGANVEYNGDPSKANWFSALTDGSYNPSMATLSQLDNYFWNELSDPMPNIVGFDKTRDFSRLNPAGWYPFPLTNCMRERVVVGDTLLPAEVISPNIIHSDFCLDSFRRPGSCKVLKKLRNVNVVFTPDKTKWSRCIVVETATPAYTDASEYGYPYLLGTPEPGPDLKQFHLKRHKRSVDVDGQQDATGTNGMGWFPGYAYDVDSGERLNVFFGENSFYRGNLGDDLPEVASMDPVLKSKFLRGDDLIFNPSDLKSAEIYRRYPNVPNSSILNYSIGGGWHNVYVTGMKYDRCEEYRKRLHNSQNAWPAKTFLFKDIIWTSMGMMAPGHDMANGVPPTKMTAKMRVKRPFDYEVGTNANAGYPMYGFKLDKLTPVMNDKKAATTALELINVVPNPYYAYSEYESNETQQIIKITNVPPRCVVNIYSLDGRFIKQYKQDLDTRLNQGSQSLQFVDINTDENNRDDLTPQMPVLNSTTGLHEYLGNRIERQNLTSIEWDLKTFYGVPVSSGCYLINVSVPDVGERTVKAFVVSRAYDAQRL